MYYSTHFWCTIWSIPSSHPQPLYFWGNLCMLLCMYTLWKCTTFTELTCRYTALCWHPLSFLWHVRLRTYSSRMSCMYIHCVCVDEHCIPKKPWSLCMYLYTSRQAAAHTLSQTVARTLEQTVAHTLRQTAAHTLKHLLLAQTTWRTYLCKEKLVDRARLIFLHCQHPTPCCLLCFYPWSREQVEVPVQDHWSDWREFTTPGWCHQVQVCPCCNVTPRTQREWKRHNITSSKNGRARSIQS